MHWIENWISISPDGGSGVAESLYAGALASTVTVAFALHRLRRRPGKRFVSVVETVLDTLGRHRGDRLDG